MFWPGVAGAAMRPKTHPLTAPPPPPGPPPPGTPDAPTPPTRRSPRQFPSGTLGSRSFSSHTTLTRSYPRDPRILNTSDLRISTELFLVCSSSLLTKRILSWEVFILKHVYLSSFLISTHTGF